ncbi:hypothetical protein H1R20_g4986, partial [Candolleomyces eurysporus]
MDSIYLIIYVQIYFVLSKETKIHLGSFIVCNLVADIINTTQGAILCPPSSPELTAAIALLNQKYAKWTPELLQQLWTLASPENLPPLIHFTSSSVALLPSDATPPDLKIAKQKRATLDPDFPKRPQCGNPNTNEPPSPPTL